MHLHRSSLAFLLFLLLWPSAATAQKPQVRQVEPPNWWAGHSHNPVRLLLSGQNLAEVQLSAPKGFGISNVIVNPTGTHAFCDLFIPPDAAPGKRTLTIKNSHGADNFLFTISPALPRSGRFSGFSPDDVIYLAMTDRFANGAPSNDDPEISRGLHNRAKPRDYHGGDFQGVLNHLPYLRDLGITALWLTPWYDNVNHPNTQEKYTRDNQRSPNGLASTDYHGYGAVDFYGVEEHFGDLAKLCELVSTAQANGMKIIQDQVANHTGPYHPWVQDPPTATWFNGTISNHLDNSWQTWTLAEPNPPPDQLKSTLEGWFINILPDLNQKDPETATYLIQNSLWWIGMTGLDGVRQDTLPYVPRRYWAQWTTALKKEYPHLTILGEMFEAKPELVAFFQGGRKQFDGVDSGVETLFDFPLYYALRDVFAKRQSATKLAQTLAADTNYVAASNLVTFLGLHDTARFMSETGATIEGLELAFTYLLTTRGTPMIYYGDEIAMTGSGDPDNRRDFPGGWADDKHNAFTTAGRTKDQERIHAHVKKLISLRRELAPLRHGTLVQLASNAETGAFARITKASAVLIAFNNSTKQQTLQTALVPAWSGKSKLFDRLTDGRMINLTSDQLTLTLAPRSAMILTPEPPNIAAESGKHQASAGRPLH